MTRAERESTPPPPAAAGFEPWWDSAGDEVHWCPDGAAGPGHYNRHGLNTWALPPGTECVRCNRIARHPPESTTLPQDASGGVGTATEIKNPSARKGEAVAATGEGAGKPRLCGCCSGPISENGRCPVCGLVHETMTPSTEPERKGPVPENRYVKTPSNFDFHREMANWQRRQQQTVRPVPGVLGPQPWVITPIPEVSKAAYEEALAEAREAQKERDVACEECERLKAKAEHCEESWKRCAGWLEDAYEAVGREERQNDKTLAELIRPIVAERKVYKCNYESVLRLYNELKKGRMDAILHERLNRKDSLMRRLARTTWRWVIVPGLVLASAAHVVPLSRVYEAARFESRGAFHEFQVCAKCSASRAGGTVCPACGSRESSSLVGREVTRAFLGVWPRETTWSAEGPVSPSGAVAEVR